MSLALVRAAPTPQRPRFIVPHKRAKKRRRINEKYTTPETMAWILRELKLEKFDLDAAACEESHWAERWFDRATNGLAQEWHGVVFCNPPWDEVPNWVAKAWSVWTQERPPELVALLLPGNRTEQPFWGKMVEPFRDGRRAPNGVVLTSRFLPGRTRYGRPGDSSGVGAGSPPFTSVLLTWAKDGRLTRS